MAAFSSFRWRRALHFLPALFSNRRIHQPYRVLAGLAIAIVAAVAEPAPQRIISTSPGITETLFALGAGDRVVAVTQYCAYPPQVKKLPKIGSWATPNMEVIVAARPDLIIVQKTAVHDSARFRALKLRTLEVKLDRVEDIYGAIDAIGAALQLKNRAQALAASIRSELAAVQNRVAKLPRTPAMFVVGRNPGTLDGIVAVGPRSYLSEVIAIAGGRNILEDSPVAYPKVLQEEIIARNPHVIVDMGEHADAGRLTPEQTAREVALYGRYKTVQAVRDKRVHIVASELYVVPGPRVVDCAQRLARFLHPEAFR